MALHKPHLMPPIILTSPRAQFHLSYHQIRSGPPWRSPLTQCQQINSQIVQERSHHTHGSAHTQTEAITWWLHTTEAEYWGILPTIHVGDMGKGNTRARKNYMHRPISAQRRVKQLPLVNRKLWVMRTSLYKRGGINFWTNLKPGRKWM